MSMKIIEIALVAAMAIFRIVVILDKPDRPKRKK